MASPINTILYRHFKSDSDPIRALIFKTGSSYEKALLSLDGVEFQYLPTSRITSISGLDFDVIISQGKREQYKELVNIAYTLHCPLISLETNLPNSPDDINSCAKQPAFVTIFSNSTAMSAWQGTNAKVIYEPLEPIKYEDVDKVYNTIHVDIDNQTLPLAQELSKIFPIAQIPQDNRQEEHFGQCGVFVNLASPNPEVMNRVKMALRANCIILTWGHPLFQELVIDGHNGYIFQNPNQLVEKIHMLRSKGIEEMRKIGQSSSTIMKTKFSKALFQKEWLRILRSVSNTLFTGV